MIAVFLLNASVYIALILLGKLTKFCFDAGGALVLWLLATFFLGFATLFLLCPPPAQDVVDRVLLFGPFILGLPALFIAGATNDASGIGDRLCEEAERRYGPY